MKSTHDDVKGIGFETRAIEEKYVISTRNIIPSIKNGADITEDEKKKYAKKFLVKREKYLKGETDAIPQRTQRKNKRS